MEKTNLTPAQFAQEVKATNLEYVKNPKNPSQIFFSVGNVVGAISKSLQEEIKTKGNVSGVICFSYLRGTHPTTGEPTEGWVMHKRNTDNVVGSMSLV